MANINRTRRKPRFSLLLLEEGEVLLSDLAVHYHFIPETVADSSLPPPHSFARRLISRSASTGISGRVKVGTHNLFFDGDEWRDPVIRIPFLSVKQARRTRNGAWSTCGEGDAGSVDVAATDEENSVFVEASRATFQRECGTDHPYVDVHMKGRHIFTPIYTLAAELMEEINMLLDITATPSRRERERRLKEVVKIRESRVPFDITLLEHGARESAIMDAAASAIYALARAPGRFRITKYNVYFMPIHGESSQVAERIAVECITAVRKLRHGCRNSSLELTYSAREEGTEQPPLSTLMISFEAMDVRDRAFGVLMDVVKHEVQLFDRPELEHTLARWRKGRISNFDYLMYLNLAAGRSFNDLSQYPVFPWVLQDYKSALLDLENADSFRDLSNPIGALNAERLQVFRARYEDMPKPKFLYGTHYSTPAYTINYLVRAAPAAMLRLQNGRFDTPDRLFHSIGSTWEGVLRNQGDVKELIPEFYAVDLRRGDCSGVLSRFSAPGQFLENVLGLELGSRQDGKRVDDVELPAWARGSAELFIRRHRAALESEHVSQRLHLWVDLIFGVKSKSAAAHNVFFTDVALPSSLDDAPHVAGEEISRIETVYLEFGRTPERLFGHPHPPRYGDDHEQVARGEPRSGTEGWAAAQEEAHEAKQAGCGRGAQAVVRCDGEREGLLLRLKTERVWRSGCNRQERTGCGASGHIVAPLKACEAQGKRWDDGAVARPALVAVVCEAAQGGVVDVALMCGEEASAAQGAGTEAESAMMCTLWEDAHVKVHTQQRAVRCKHVADMCSMATLPRRMIACGTVNGGIGLYVIDTGRLQEAVVAAHDAAVYALEYVPELDVLLSGSKDGSLKVWRVGRCAQRGASLRLAVELDAESCVVDICACCEAAAAAGGAGDGARRGRTLLVAACTTDQNVLVWEVDVDKTDKQFVEAMWRQRASGWQAKGGDGAGAGRWRRMTWVWQGGDARAALATVHPDGRWLRIWKLDDSDTAFAEVLLCEESNALCITSHARSATVLVGGAGGRINEYDSTGLCVGGVVAGHKHIRRVMVAHGGTRVYALCGANEVVRMDAEAQAAEATAAVVDVCADERDA